MSVHLSSCHALNNYILNRQAKAVQNFIRSDQIQEISDEDLGSLFLSSYGCSCPEISETLASACAKRDSLKKIHLLPTHYATGGRLDENQRGWALKGSAEFGLSAIVQELLWVHRFDPDDCRAHGAVIYAARNKHVEVLRLLRKSERSIGICKGCLESALLAAALKGHKEGLEILLEPISFNMKRIDISYFETMLKNAKRSGNAETIEFTTNLIPVKEGLDRAALIEARALAGIV
ncbi:MAG TPA: ankyrin repeat domain-containing protein [Chlamydiales bacterium]|nr:ankyrin repeat domain-containing protein [Chlamydiales bacterium]